MELETDPRQLVSQIKARWRQEGDPDAVKYLSIHPVIRQQKSLALELAYEEYCLREEAGTSINIPAFCDRFPTICHSLQRQLEVHRYFQSNPDALDRDASLPWPQPGETFLGFRIIEQLGQGGLARVFLCAQPMIGDRQVVIKIAHQGAYEADTLGRLKHPNIVPVYAVVEDESSGMSGISMPFCGRSTLCDVLDLAFAEKSYPGRAEVILQAAMQHAQESDRYDRVEAPDRRITSASYVTGAVSLGLQLADALRHAHQQGILHGDLKPSNILVTPAGRPMLLDFNLSHNPLRPTAMTGGTLPYMAPEQVRGTVLKSQADEDQVDPRADIYSLGTILYELLCGQLPYGPVVEPIATAELAHRRLAAQQRGHRSLSESVRPVDRSLASLIDQCLAYDRQSRPASMSEVAQRLARHLRPTRRVARWTRVHRRAVLAAAAGLVLTGGSGAVVALDRALYPSREFNRGLQLYDAKDYEQAAIHFSHAMDAYLPHPQAQKWLGLAYLEQGKTLHHHNNFIDAISYFSRAMEAYPPPPEAQQWLGLAYFEQGKRLYRDGNFSEAADFFRRIDRRYRKFKEALYGQGRAYIKQGEIARSKQDLSQQDLVQAERAFRNAVTAFEQLKRSKPEGDGRCDACLGYAISVIIGFGRQGHAEAYEAYRNALAKGFKSIGLYNNLGYTRVMGHFDEATEFLDEALSLARKNGITPPPAVYLNLARADLERARQIAGQWQRGLVPEPYMPRRGIEAIEKVIERSPDAHPYVYCTAARLYGYAAYKSPQDDEKCLRALRMFVAHGTRSELMDIDKEPSISCVRQRHSEVITEMAAMPRASSPLVRPGLLDPVDESL
jgi:serine/threonine protein kinase/Flp pilus assembly protein TadD